MTFRTPSSQTSNADGFLKIERHFVDEEMWKLCLGGGVGVQTTGKAKSPHYLQCNNTWIQYRYNYTKQRSSRDSEVQRLAEVRFPPSNYPSFHHHD